MKPFCVNILISSIVALSFLLGQPQALQAQVSVNEISTSERRDGQGYVVRLHVSERINTFQLQQVNFSEVRLQIETPVANPDAIPIEDLQHPFRNIQTDRLDNGGMVITIQLARSVQLRAEAYQDRLSNDLLLGLSYVKNQYQYAASDSLVRRMIDLIPTELDKEAGSSTYNLEPLQTIYTKKFREMDQYELNKQELEAQIDTYSSDIGLEMQASYRQNFDQGFEIGSGISYLRRGQVGLEWDALSGGLLESRNQVSRLKNELRAVDVNKAQAQKENRYSQQYNAIIELFNAHKIDLLERERKSLEAQLQEARRFYHAKSMTWEEVLDIMSNLEQNKTQLENYRTYNAQNNISFDASIQASSLPMVDVQIDRIIQNIENSELDKRLYELQADNIDQQHSFWRDISLSAFVDYTYYDAAGPGFFGFGSVLNDRGYFSAGIQLGVPLPLGRQSNQDLAEAQKEQLQNRNATRNYEERKQVLNHYYEYRYFLWQYTNFLSTKRNLQEQIRTDRARWRIDDPNFNLPTLWSHINQLYNVEQELIDIKQQAYLKLLRIFTYVDQIPVTELVTPINSGEMYQKYDARRSIYVWSDTFDEQRLSFLTEHMINNRIEEVILSPDNEAIRTGRVADFISSMHEEDIEVHRLAGINGLIEPDRLSRLNDMIAQTDTLGFDGLHLDVEPHTFADWESRRAYYQQNYLEMLQQSETLLDSVSTDLKLSVSVPVSYSGQFLDQIQHHADKIFVMAYGLDTPEDVLQKTKDERALTESDIIIAVRTGDFRDRVEMESYLRELTGKGNLSSIAIHDLAGFLNLEDQIINSIGQ